MESNNEYGDYSEESVTKLVLQGPYGRCHNIGKKVQVCMVSYHDREYLGALVGL